MTTKLNSIRTIAGAAALLMSVAAFAQKSGADSTTPQIAKGLATGAGNPTQMFIDKAHCGRDVANWQRHSFPTPYVLTPRYSPPSYDCAVWEAQERTTGINAQNWAAPSVDEYRAWQLALNNYLQQPFVRPYLDSRPYMSQEPKYYWLQADVAKANFEKLARGRDYLMGLNPMYNNAPNDVRQKGSAADSAAVVCSMAQRDAIKGMKNKALRDQALANLDANCKGALDKQAQFDAKAAAERAAADAYKLPTAADLQPLPERGLARLSGPELHKVLTEQGFEKRVIGSADAPVEMHMVLDLGDKLSSFYLLQLWPTVREGQLRLVVYPTSLASKDPRPGAVFLRTDKPFALLNNWLENMGRVSKYNLGAAQGLLEVQPNLDVDVATLGVAGKAAVESNDKRVLAADLRVLPSYAVRKADGTVHQYSWGSELTPATRGVLSLVNIYSEQQVAHLSREIPSCGQVAGLGAGFLECSTETMPYGYNATRADYKISKPDWSSVKEVCGVGGECWKAPAPKTGWF